MTLIQNLENISDTQLLVLLIWTVIWKGIALWKCGRNNQIRWFIAILILNTVGLLPIAYILWFQKKQNNDATTQRNNRLK